MANEPQTDQVPPNVVQSQYPPHEHVAPYLTPLGAAEYRAGLAAYQADQMARQAGEAQQRAAVAEQRVAELEAEGDEGGG